MFVHVVCARRSLAARGLAPGGPCLLAARMQLHSQAQPFAPTGLHTYDWDICRLDRILAVSTCLGARVHMFQHTLCAPTEQARNANVRPPYQDRPSRNVGKTQSPVLFEHALLVRSCIAQAKCQSTATQFCMNICTSSHSLWRAGTRKLSPSRCSQQQLSET